MAGLKGVTSDEFWAGFNSAVTEVLSNEETCSKLKSVLLYKPLMNTLSLGIYSMFSKEESLGG